MRSTSNHPAFKKLSKRVPQLASLQEFPSKLNAPHSVAPPSGCSCGRPRPKKAFRSLRHGACWAFGVSKLIKPPCAGHFFGIHVQEHDSEGDHIQKFLPSRKRFADFATIQLTEGPKECEKRTTAVQNLDVS